MRALVIEDDSATARSIELILAKGAITCDIAQLGTKGVEIAKIHDYDIIILDLKLPDMYDFEALLRIRYAKIKTPVLILSGMSSIDQKVKGLSLGADDYLTKPCDESELLARVHAIIRRSKGQTGSVVKVGKMSVDLESRIVEINNRRVHLTNKEYAILELLVTRRDSVLAKETFLNHLYGNMDEPEIKIIDVFVCKLRKKLSDASGGVDYIETAWGRGYMLREFEEEVAPKASSISGDVATEVLHKEILSKKTNKDSFDEEAPSGRSEHVV